MAVKKRKAARPGILEEIQAALPNRKGLWIQTLAPDARKALEEVRDAKMAGKLMLGQKVLEFLIAKFDLPTNPTALRNWLTR